LALSVNAFAHTTAEQAHGGPVAGIGLLEKFGHHRCDSFRPLNLRRKHARCCLVSSSAAQAEARYRRVQRAGRAGVEACQAGHGRATTWHAKGKNAPKRPGPQAAWKPPRCLPHPPTSYHASTKPRVVLRLVKRKKKTREKKVKKNVLDNARSSRSPLARQLSHRWPRASRWMRRAHALAHPARNSCSPIRNSSYQLVGTVIQHVPRHEPLKPRTVFLAAARAVGRPSWTQGGRVDKTHPPHHVGHAPPSVARNLVQKRATECGAARAARAHEHVPSGPGLCPLKIENF